MTARLLAIPITLVLLPCHAEIEWRDFEITSYEEKPQFTLRDYTCGLRAIQDPQRDRGESLELTVRDENMKEDAERFTSSYGMLSLAIDGDLLLLKYGIGRGTCVRTEQVRIFKIGNSLTKLGEFPVSYWHNASGAAETADPVCHEATVDLKREGKAAIFSIVYPKDSPERPPDLSVKIGQ